MTSTLLADTVQVAIIRDLITYARKFGASHYVYTFVNGTGQNMGPREHTWDLGVEQVKLMDDTLMYRRNGRTIMRVREVTSARQAADLLASIGVLPASFVVVPPVWVDRMCRRCGATQGLRLLPGNPLVAAGPEWQCVEGCPTEQAGR